MDDEQANTLSNTGLTHLQHSNLAPGNEEKHLLLMQTLSEAQVDFLMQRTPKREIKMRQGRGGMQFAYVEHGYVTERLNLVFGFNWDFEIVDKQILDDEVIVEARLTVRTPGGQTIVKTQFGGAEIKRHASGPRTGRPLSIADDYKAAASDALKKCASLLGIGLDLYGRDRPAEPESETGRSADAHQPAPTTPSGPGAPVSTIDAAPHGSATQPQIRRISELSKAAGMSSAELCGSLGIADLGELTEGRAARVLRRLEELAGSEQQQAS